MAASPGSAEPLESSTTEHPEAVKPPTLPIDEAEPRPPLLGEAAAHEAISPEKSASPSSLPANLAVEVSPDVEASSSSPSPSPSPSPAPSPPPQIVEASLDAPQQLSTAPAVTWRASTDLSITEAVAMASQEAARPSPSPESTDVHLHTASALLMPPMEIGPGGLLPQQQPRPPSPEIAPRLCDYSEPAEPSPLCHPDQCTGGSPDAPVDEAVAGTSGMAAGPFQAVNSKFAQLPQPHLPAESTYVCSNAAGKVSAVASEEGTQPVMEAIDGEGPFEIGAQGSLQEPEETATSPRMEAEPRSPEMAPPGFEDCKSQWLPLSHPNPLVESTHTVVQVTATNAMDTTPDADAATGLPSSPGLLPLLKRGAEGQTVPRSCSPTAEAAPGSPDTPPPGFENCKSSWLPLPTLQPIAETTYVLHDLAPTKAMPMGFMEKACSVLALERTDVEIDSERSLLSPLESEAGSSLQGPLPRSPSPMMQATPCSPDTAPPGFENLKFTQLQPPSLPLVQSAHLLQNSADNGAMSAISEEAPQPPPALDAMDLDMDVDMDVKPVLAPPSESKLGKSLPPEPPLLLSHCSVGMVSFRSENIESSQLLPPVPVLPLDEATVILADARNKKTVTMEEVCHPLPVAGEAEEANGSVLPPAMENGCEGQSPHLEPHVSSPAVDTAATSLEIAPRSYEASESSQSQLLSPCLAETVDPSTHASSTMPVIVKSEKTNLPLSPLQATGIDMESAILQQSPAKSEERSLPQPDQHLSSLSVKDSTYSPEDAPPGYENFDSLDQLPPPPPLCSKFEMGQMVCGSCRQLVAYPRASAYVQCFGCSTINLVLEEHQVGKAYCGQCDTLLMYPFGAPAVKCSNCLFVTEIGEKVNATGKERNVRPRILVEQSVSPDPQEVVHQS